MSKSVSAKRYSEQTCKMIKPILLLLCFLSKAYASDECEACTLQIESAIKCLNDIVKKIEPVVTSECLPCKRCQMTGASDFSLTKGTQVCTETIDGGKLHTVSVTFKKVVFDCQCELDCNPANLPKKIAKGFKSQKIMDCSPKDQTIASAGKITGHKRMGLRKMVTLNECQPKVFGVPLSGSGGVGVGVGIGDSQVTASGSSGSSSSSDAPPKVCVNGTASGTLHAEWPNFDISFTTVTKKDSKTVTIGAVTVLSTNYKDLLIQCSGDDPNFQDSCNCLTATEFHINFITKAIEMLLPCQVNQQLDKYEKILLYFKCDEADY